MTGGQLLLEAPGGLPRIEDDPRGEIRISLWVAGAFFLGVLGLAAVVPLDAGAYAHGQIAVAGNRQAVQHRDGGIVSALMVREGDMVAAGQPLLAISDGDIRALERGLTGDYLTLLAERARLLASAQGSQELAVPPEFAALPAEDRPIAAEALRTQERLLHSQLAAGSAQKSVLSEQSSQVRAKIGGLAAEGSALSEQRRLIEQELEGMRELAKEGYASQNRIRELERAQAALKGDESSRGADIASARETIGQNRMQAVVVDRDRIEKADQQLRDVTQQLSEVQPKLIAARQQLARALVRAPVAGRVVGLKVFTVGGVVGAGQTLMEVVPQNRELVIQAQMSPDDIDDIHPGVRVKVRFPTLHDRSLPDVIGTIATISADAITDEKTQARYFAAEVHVPRGELDKLTAGKPGRSPIQAGVPVEVLALLEKRTMLDYLIEPVTQSFWRTGREH